MAIENVPLFTVSTDKKDIYFTYYLERVDYYFVGYCNLDKSSSIF